jgi:hypothetical protein
MTSEDLRPVTRISTKPRGEATMRMQHKLWHCQLALLAVAGLSGLTARAQSANGNATTPPKQQFDLVQPQELPPGKVMFLMQDKNPDGSALAELPPPAPGLMLQLQTPGATDKDRADMIFTVDASSRRVKDKPYAASAVTDTIQTLADGNRIVHHLESRTYRDSSGRTRREEALGALPEGSSSQAEKQVFLSDPVAGANFILNQDAKTARRLSTHVMLLRTPAPTGENEPPPPAQIIIGDAEIENHDGKLLTVDSSKDTKTEDLGERTIQGLSCTGKRTTITIPAGARGNERPIVITREVWYSNDIEAIVESTTNDPRSGETHYVLKDIDRSEQPLSLFEPPAQFKLELDKH